MDPCEWARAKPLLQTLSSSPNPCPEPSGLFVSRNALCATKRGLGWRKPIATRRMILSMRSMAFFWTVPRDRYTECPVLFDIIQYHRTARCLGSETIRFDTELHWHLVCCCSGALCSITRGCNVPAQSWQTWIIPRGAPESVWVVTLIFHLRSGRNGILPWEHLRHTIMSVLDNNAQPLVP